MKQVLRKDSHRHVNQELPRTDSEVSELMLAVLEDAMRTYKDGVDSPIPAKRVEAFKVEAWVMSDDTDWPFAFVNVCNAVGLNPGYVRTAMRKWRRKTAREPAWIN
jgi:hypothetical protein